ncbi:MAG: hypothetical protein HGB12_05145 [Bacteroidetes bacterium]|nr:hypothetical protein [Bacteroidota bacterium]
MKFRFIIIINFIFLSYYLYSGNNSYLPPHLNNIQNTSFTKENPDLDFKVAYLEALDLFNYEYYNEALNIFLKLLPQDINNSNLNFYVGVCYLKSKKQKSRSIDYLKKAVKNTDVVYSYSYKATAAPVFAFLYLGQAFHLIGKYNDALINFEKFQYYLTNKNKDGNYANEVTKCIEMTKQAIKLTANPIKIKIEPFKIVNSIYSDFSPNISHDGNKLYFSSKRKGCYGGEKDNFSEYFDDIFFTQFLNNKWIKPKKVGSKINTTSSDVLCCFSPDGNQLYFTRKVRETYDIFVSELSPKNKWLPPQKLGININSKENELNAFITSDKNTMLFSSDRPGGYGGYDIYISEKLSTGEWGKPFNLGPEVNSSNDEICPVLMPDGTLYFSSNGFDTMGGFDIFITTISENGLWAKPENIGYPLNTTSDDINFTPTSTDGKKGYYTSARSDCYGDSDIYSFSFE